MITKRQYQILLAIVNQEEFYQPSDRKELDDLIDQKIIAILPSCFNNCYKYQITKNTQRKIEEYEHFLEEKNQSKRTQKIARNANIISAIALLATLISLILSVLAFVR